MKESTADDRAAKIGDLATLAATDDQTEDLERLEETVEPIWKTALAARNKADECLHAIRALKTEMYELKQRLLKQALEIAQIEDK